MSSFVLAADMGGTRIKLGLLEGGRIIARSVHDAESQKPIEWQMSRLDGFWRDLCRQSGINISDISGVGIAFPAIIDPMENRPLDYYGKYPGSTEFDFDKWAEKAFGCSCVLENDARCALLGESYFGAGKGVENLVMFTLGTGIGSALMEKGELTGGERGISGNLLGHRPVSGNDTPCLCGRMGCAEAATSLPEITRLIEKSERYASSSLEQYDSIDYRILFQLRREGDPLAVEISNSVMDIWANSMVPALEEFGAEIIIIGGGIMASGDIILPHIEKSLKKIDSHINCAAALCGDDAGLFGAGRLIQEGS